jgi:hypothetical protein
MERGGITTDQGELLGAAPAFDLTFAGHGLGTCWELLAINDAFAGMGLGEARPALGVLDGSAVGIVADGRVQGAIDALDDAG